MRKIGDTSLEFSVEEYNNKVTVKSKKINKKRKNLTINQSYNQKKLWVLVQNATELVPADERQ